ncbi:MAG: radical SAM protein [Nitrospirae bacterium]|nr:radical SAM protein [Nitrospirota bacterium]
MRHERGDATLILDCSLENSSEIKTARRAMSYKPDIIGFSIMTAQNIPSVNAIYDECNRISSGHNIQWLAGGNFISSELSQAMKILPERFFLCQFEGERALEGFVQSLPLQTTHRDDQGRVVTGKTVEDLDSLPFPRRPFIDIVLQNKWSVNIQGSRGCCGTCKYCASPGMSAQGTRKWRGRSMENIVQEIAWLNYQYGVVAFNFVDEDFLGPNHLARQRAIALSKGLAQRNLKVSIGIQVRPDSLTHEIIDILTGTGVSYFFIGIESDSPDDFKRWGRPYHPDIWKTMAYLQHLDVVVHAGVMLFHQHSTLQGIRQFAGKLHIHGLFNYVSAVNRLDAIPGSFFYKSAIKENIIKSDDIGPQPLQFLSKEVECFYEDLLHVLAPLGPPYMHAICSLPYMSGVALRDPRNHDYANLKATIQPLNETVWQSFLSLLNAYEHGGAERAFVNQMRHNNLSVAIESVKTLVRNNLAPSFETLREAIRIDSGL